jgi:hypothetical protein
LPQPGGESSRIETDRATDPETGYPILSGEFVNLAFGDIQQFSDIGDGEGVRPPIERVREIHRPNNSTSPRQSGRYGRK